jgi:TonB family protein
MNHAWKRLVRIGIVASALVSISAQAQDARTVFRIGDGVSTPSVIRKVEPEYSAEARAARVEGSVVLEIVVTAEGKATVQRILRHSMKNKDTGEMLEQDYGLGEKAKEAVSQWLFRPGAKGGQPVDVKANVEVNFRLN